MRPESGRTTDAESRLRAYLALRATQHGTVACTLAGFDDGFDDELGDTAERTRKCNLDHVKWIFRVQKGKFKRLLDGAEAGLEDLRGGGEGQQ
ncbi:hypothetical protein DL771_007817 [Monosporascus sp. 5C6A]|nr:hypothetical protein DL771_007817 [Monosporascus sp. 5C6A]